jgi:drug/metabolite transporter (DMT)-like permease
MQTQTAAKVGVDARGAALAVTTGACLAAGYSLLSDHDERRLKKSVLGGSLGFLGSYLFIRGSRFDDVQTAAVVAGIMTVIGMVTYSTRQRR